MSKHSVRPFTRRLGLCMLAVLLLQFFWGCNYARMYDDDAYDTYQTKQPDPPRKTIPITGGIEMLKTANLDTLKNPLQDTQQMVAQGKERYGFYCIQCHGPKGDGKGTVGQSFVPLPTDLRAAYVQDQADGEMFYKINLGFNRHPPLAYTVSPEETWAIIWYIRSLGKPGQVAGRG